jgi:hypothetical protein
MLMIEDAKMDRPKKNVTEELNEIPLDDLNMFDDMSKSFFKILSYFLFLHIYRLSVHRDTWQCYLFHHVLPTILHQHPPPIRHWHLSHSRNSSLVLSLPPALLLLPCSSLTPAKCLDIFHLLNSNNSSHIGRDLDTR